MGVQMELFQLQPHLMSWRRPTNTDATGTLSLWGTALIQTVRERESHGAVLPSTPDPAWCVWPFPRLFHTRAT